MASTEKPTPNYLTDLFHAPGRTAGPLAQSLAGPFRGLIVVTGVAGVGHFALRRRRRRDELEGMGADVRIGKLRFDLWHVAVHAFVARGAGLVLSVGLNG